MSAPLHNHIPTDITSAPLPKTEQCIFRSVALRRPSAIKRSVAQVSSIRCANAHPIARKNITWQLADREVKVVPPHYPLERTRRTIRGITASEIAVRVSCVARSMNIVATYDNENATARLSTLDHVEFFINLYQHPDCAGGTIVEAQRWRGCGILFHRYAHGLLDAAEGLPIDINIANGIAKKGNMIESFGKDDDSVRDALTLADKLLQDVRVDAQQLGMEMLLRMTQPEAVSFRTALLTSRAIVFGTSLHTNSQNDTNESDDKMHSVKVQEKVLSFIGSANPRDEVGGMHQFYEERLNVLSNIALHVFANALDIITTKGLGIKSVERRVIIGLAQFLENANERPHHAYLSAKCLGILLVSSQQARKSVSELGLVSAMRGASEAGLCAHAGLEMEMEKVAEALAVTAEA